MRRPMKHYTCPICHSEIVYDEFGGDWCECLTEDDD